MPDLPSIQNDLILRKQKGLLRQTFHMDEMPGPIQKENESSFFNMISNDYLGLAGHPKIIQAANEATKKWGCGSTGSRLLGGGILPHRELELRFAKERGYEDALFFNNGYSANVGVLSSLLKKNEIVYTDRLVHASILDGIRLSGAKIIRYKHLDSEHLETLLQKYGSGLIVTESVFSMDGDISPLLKISELAQKHQCLLMVDEAHADGLFGPNGRGLIEELQLQNKVDIALGTFGKAYACFGACVACSSLLRSHFVNYARSFIYATALPASVPASVMTSMDVAQQEPERRLKALQLAESFRKKIQALGFDTLQSESQIVPIILGSNERALSAVSFLKQLGFLTAAIREPTVPKGTARLRINFTAGHPKETPQLLADALQKFLQLNSRESF